MEIVLYDIQSEGITDTEDKLMRFTKMHGCGNAKQALWLVLRRVYVRHAHMRPGKQGDITI